MNSGNAESLPASPLISVCVPMYNNGATIARCLRSVLDQDGEFEILVVDDDSSDDGVAIAATMLRAGDRLVRNESNLGGHKNHDRCLELARASIIQFVHGDDELLPGALETLVRCFEDPSVGLAFAPRRVVTENLEWLRYCGTIHTYFRRLDEYNDGPSLVAQMVARGMPGNWIGEPTSVMFRRELAMDVGGFREEFFHLADIDMWLRLLLRSSARFVPQELAVRYHATERDSTTRPWWLDRLRILTWMIVDPASPTVIRIMSGLWWLPVWLRLTVEEAMISGPDRRSRLKTLSLAPFREFAHFWRLRDGL